MGVFTCLDGTGYIIHRKCETLTVQSPLDGETPPENDQIKPFRSRPHADHGSDLDDGLGRDHVRQGPDLHHRILLVIEMLVGFRRKLRVLAAVLAFAGAAAAMAQGKLTVSGKLRVDGGNLDDCKLVVYKDGEKQRTLTTDLNKFTLDLDLGANYILSFEKNGFVTKKLSFNTNVPAAQGATPFMPFAFVVSIFKQYNGVNTVVFNQPVGMIRYDDTQEEFDYDTDYTKSIQSALEDAQEAVAEKQKQEADKEADAAKQKVSADKEKAKQDARAAKEAEAKAKVDERARKEADERAAKDARLAQLAAKPEPEPKPEPKPESKPVPKAEPKPEPKPELKPKELPKPPAPPPPPKPRPEPKPAPPPAPKKMPPPPEAPVAKVRQKPVAPRSVLPAVEAKVLSGGDERIAVAPRMESENSTVQPAKVRSATEPRPKFEETTALPVRHKEVVVEPGQVITVVRVEQGNNANEYRKVVRKYSGTFYFKDGSSCSQTTYEREALAVAGE